MRWRLTYPAILAILPTLLSGAMDAVQGGEAPGIDDGWLVEAPRLGRWLVRPSGDASVDWCLAAGIGRLYEMPELPVRGLGLMRRGDSTRARLAWSRCGGETWREDEVQLEAVAGAGQRIGLALDLAITRTGSPVTPVRRARLLPSLVWRWRMGSDLQGDLRFDLPESGDVAPGRGRRSLGGASWRSGNWFTALRIDRRLQGGTSARLAIHLKATSGVSLGVICLPSGGQWGGLFAFRRGALMLRGSHLTHPLLGQTHRWEVCRFWPGPF